MSDSEGRQPAPNNPSGPDAREHRSTETSPRTSDDSPVSTPARPLDLDELTGLLPCVRCKYNLKGLTVTGMCPECGTSVRTTLLAVVDPLARELRPIECRKLTAIGVVAWSVGALLATLFLWAIRLTDWWWEPGFGTGWRARGLPPWPTVLPAYAVVFFTIVSGLGSLAFIRPHAGLSRSHRLQSALGSLFYMPLALTLYHILIDIDLHAPRPYSLDAGDVSTRSIFRLIASGLVLAIIICVRRGARVLQARLLLMRVGALGRQTLLAMIGVVLLWTIGDLLVLYADHANPGVESLPRNIGRGLILVGSLLFTLGLFGVVLDAWRVRGVVLQPAIDLADMLIHRSNRRAGPFTPPSPDRSRA
ncbi:MAG: hypothetical protein AB7Q00_01815 [Phycisphaerales bacterium]